MTPPALHAVTNDAIISRPNFFGLAVRVMCALGSKGALQLRTRWLPAARLYELAAALTEAERSTGCWVIVNDRLDIALASAAHGAQLTSHSLTVEQARIAAPKLPLGASVHSVEEAVAAANSGADWIVAGHVYSTPSHPGQPGRGVELVSAITAATTIPCIAIGGIRPKHVPALRAAGAHGVAVIRGIWDASDAERAAFDYVSAYDSHYRS
ncbi:MAG TPA: thiamine phosphate synthase [Gemmatimonadaceae bacterium]|nr:thiamine phosphate synthase [Gemmatimonadaceae bacterium]